MRNYLIYHRSILTDKKSQFTGFGPHMLRARVLAEDLSHVWELTNHGTIEEHWPDNAGVTLATVQPVRSSMIGDWIQDEESGELWDISSVGFTALGKNPVPDGLSEGLYHRLVHDHGPVIPE